MLSTLDTWLKKKKKEMESELYFTPTFKFGVFEDQESCMASALQTRACWISRRDKWKKIKDKEDLELDNITDSIWQKTCSIYIYICS